MLLLAVDPAWTQGGNATHRQWSACYTEFEHHRPIAFIALLIGESLTCWL